MPQDAQIELAPARSLPGKVADNAQAVKLLRGTPFGEAAVQPYGRAKQNSNDEGTLFVASSLTPGTGVAYALQTAFSDTVGAFAVFNKASASGARIQFHYLKLILTAAPTATVSLELEVRLDPKDRTPTGATLAAVPVCPNSDLSPGSIATVNAFNAGSQTLPAAGSAVRNASRGHIATGLGIVGDEYVFTFGSDDFSSTAALTAARATTPAKFVEDCGPVEVGPQGWALFHLWWLTAATTAPSFEWELCWSER